ncbi:MAG: Maf family protein [Thioalkalispiraceae bacterium]|jgi:septum formation protein
MDVDIYLASQSPRRSELLRQLGVRFAVSVANVDETRQPAESPETYVQRLAVEKAKLSWQSLPKAKRRPVLGADTTVCLAGEILGKPADKADAISMLKRLSGQRHEVMSGVAIIGEKHSVCVNVSQVSFRKLTDSEIEEYWKTGEPNDKAGAYAIQGYAAAFISGLQGSYSGVMGLPLFETARLLSEHNIPIWQT